MHNVLKKYEHMWIYPSGLVDQDPPQPTAWTSRYIQGKDTYTTYAPKSYVGNNEQYIHYKSFEDSSSTWKINWRVPAGGDLPQPVTARMSCHETLKPLLYFTEGPGVDLSDPDTPEAWDDFPQIFEQRIWVNGIEWQAPLIQAYAYDEGVRYLGVVAAVTYHYTAKIGRAHV
mgnify:FL=1